MTESVLSFEKSVQKSVNAKNRPFKENDSYMDYLT